MAMAMAMALALADPMRQPFQIEGQAPLDQAEALLPPAQRIRRSRRKGYRLPLGAIYVGRPTVWGNPFSVGPRSSGGCGGHARCTILHKAWLQGRISDLALERLDFCPAQIEALHRKRYRILTSLHTLAGHDLACWCPLTSEWCHAQTYLVLASSYAQLESFAA